eukprot:TRINITY_DN535_c0_g1_i1.p1 TRINITY_DN535_c0_g1~~TRINITY_DN535_c0_g1_i1.p1  ORF type:complete len:208 (-),score=27.84 TRINITY_DN535_c0_g1_i1:87-710(-)
MTKRLVGIIVFRWINPDTNPVLLASQFDLSDLYFYQRGTAKEVCMFAGRELVKRITPQDAKSIKHGQFICHGRVLSIRGGLHLGCAVLTDETYIPRVAYGLMGHVFERMMETYDVPDLTSVSRDTEMKAPFLAELLERFQKPEEADSILRLQRQVDETKEVLLESLDALMERGDKLDDLVSRSQDLSFKSRAFVKEAERMNCSCVLF